VASWGVVEPVDVLEDRRLGFPPCLPVLTPDHLGLQQFEERLDRCVVVAVAFAAHRWPQALGQQLILIIIVAILTATIRMEGAAFGGVPHAYRHIPLQSIADRPANDAATVQIKNDREVEPSLCSSYIGDIASPFLARSIGRKIAIQPVCRNAKLMIAVGGDLMLTGANGPDPIDVPP
jgi:hypothetical protein